MFRLVIFSCLFLATFADSESRPNSREEKIVGGYDGSIISVPYQVSVQYGGGHWCGGSIIGPKHILTAAHCVEGKNDSLLSIRAGSSYHDEGGQERNVAKVIGHPDYNRKGGNCDAAILVLSNSLTASQGVSIATLANVEPKVGEMALISGWGSTGEQEDFSTVLKTLSMPIVSRLGCKERYKLDLNITEQMFCAGFVNGNMDTCYGDSGGPAVVNGKLAGIVSWGDGCAYANSPTVFTQVSSILSWISNNTKE